MHRSKANTALVRDTHCITPAAGGAIRGTRCGAVTGSASHAPMT